MKNSMIEREIEIAQHMARQVAWSSFSATTPDEELLEQIRETVARQIEIACQRHQLDERARNRIVFKYLPAEIGKIHRAASVANAHVNTLIYSIAGGAPLRSKRFLDSIRARM
jgi:hypothetical protein